LASFLPFIRFPHMHVDFLCDVVNENEMIQQLPQFKEFFLEALLFKVSSVHRMSLMMSETPRTLRRLEYQINKHNFIDWKVILTKDKKHYSPRFCVSGFYFFVCMAVGVTNTVGFFLHLDAGASRIKPKKKYSVRASRILMAKDQSTNLWVTLNSSPGHVFTEIDQGAGRRNLFNMNYEDLLHSRWVKYNHIEFRAEVSVLDKTDVKMEAHT